MKTVFYALFLTVLPLFCNARVIDVRCFAVSSNGHLFAGNYGDGIYRSTNNGNEWVNISGGLTNAFIRSLAINSNNHIFAGTDGGGVFLSTDNGNNWSQTGPIDPYSRFVSLNSLNYVFAVSGNKVFRSTDNGSNWTQLNPGFIPLDIHSLFISSNDYIFVGTVDQLLIRSTDDGQNWTINNTGLGGIARCFAFNSMGYIFIGTQTAGVFRSTDNGNNWTQINPLEGFNTIVINSNQFIFAGIGGGASGAGVFRSTDNGNNWTSVGLSGIYVNILAINSPGYIFAGTYGGVYRSTDNGENWTPINNGLPATDIEVPNGNAPIVFSLEQNYPNPFNPATNIEYILPQISDVELIIYNPRGQKIRTLLNRIQPAGTYEVQWDGRDEHGAPAGSGIYIYRLKAGNFVQARKMVLLR